MSNGNSAKNLITYPPVALTTSWALVLPDRQDRKLLLLYNVGTDVVHISTAPQQDAATVAPTNPTNIYSIPSGGSLHFPAGEAPRRLWAKAAANIATLNIIDG